MKGDTTAWLGKRPLNGLQARHVLEKIRGTKDVDEEFQDILEKAELAALVKNPWTLLLFRKKYRSCSNPYPSAVIFCSSLKHTSAQAGKGGPAFERGLCLPDCTGAAL